MEPPVKYVDEDEIRRIFAEGCYFERTQAGEFGCEVRGSGHR
jgi:hypothetical protein